MTHPDPTSLQQRRWDSIGRLFAGSFKIFNARVIEHLAAQGHPTIGVTQSAVIRSMTVGGTTISELAHRAGISRQAMSQLVSDLEGEGYVALGPHPTDGRAELVTYTARGQHLAEDAFACVQEIEGEMTRKIGTRKMQTLRSLLEELIDDTPETEQDRAAWFRGF